MTIKLSAVVGDDDRWRDVAERLTNVRLDLPLTELIAPLGLYYSTELDQVMTGIWAHHNDGVEAAFAAGIAIGRDPALLLLEVTP